MLEKPMPLGNAAQELDRLRGVNRQLTRYLQALHLAHADLDVERTLEAVLDSAEELFGCTAAMVVLGALGAPGREVLAARGLSEAFIHAIETSLWPVCARLAEEPMLALGVGAQPHAVELQGPFAAAVAGAGIRGALLFRLDHGGEMLGALYLFFPHLRDTCCEEQQVAEIFAAQAAGAIVHARDYQAAHRLRREREESQQQLQAILDCLQDRVMVWDADCRLVLANASAWQLLDELGWRAADGSVTLRSDPTTCPVHAVLHQPEGTVRRNIVLGGRVFEVDCHPLRDPASEALLAVVEQVRDVTETRRLQRELAHSEERFREALRHAPAGIVLVDAATGRVQIANGMLAELTGRTEQELAGTPWLELFAEADRPRLESAAAQLLLERQRTELETRLLGGDEPIPVVALMGRIEYSDGTRGMQLMLRDMRLRLRLQAQLVEQEKLAAIGQLASGVAHEIRNPLSIIAGAIFDLEDLIESGDPEVAEDLRIARDEIRRVQEIISNVLDFARAGGQERESVDLRLLLERAVALAQKSLASRNVRLKLEVDGEPTVWASPGSLRQVVLNLLTNSYQATPDGGEITVRAWAEGDTVAAFSIADTGSGIPPEVLGSIFNPFFTTKAPGQGTGLGLSIVHSAVRDLGGAIAVDSEPGKGTLFTIRLPRQPVEPDQSGRATPLAAVVDPWCAQAEGAW